MGKAKDLTGMRFGSLTAIQKTDKRVDGRIIWKCQCDCGNIVETSGKNLLSGHRKRCPDCKAENLKEMRFGYLTVLDRVKDIEKNDGYAYWKCKCDCGKITIVPSNHLKSGHTRSCGCLQREKVKESATTHGLSKEKLHNIWMSMISRCENISNSSYRNYGARGVTVCQEWKSDFMTFYTWAIINGYREGLSIERKDVNGNYEPDNCTWATYKEQQNNKRNNHFITFNGRTQTMTQWAEEIGISCGTLSNRINVAKWSVERALTEPINEKYRKK